MSGEEVPGGDSDLWHLQVDKVAQETGHLDPPEVKLKINRQEMRFVIDTGSPVSTIGSATSVPGLRLGRSHLVLTSFTGHNIPIKGEGEVTVQHGLISKPLKLVVANLPKSVNLLGRDWISALGLNTDQELHVSSRKLDEVLREHEEVFSDELGKVPIKV